MKNKIVIILLLTYNCQVMNAQQSQQHIELQELGLSFDIPVGWTGQAQGDYIFLGHHTIPGIMVLSKNTSTNTAALKKLALQGITDEGVQLNAKGNFIIKGNRVEGMYEGYFDGTQVTCFGIGLINNLGDGMNIHILTEPNKFTNTHKVEASKLANSVQFYKSKETEITLQWKSKIVGKRLKYASSTSDNDYTGGSSSVSITKIYDLCSNGQYSYYGNTTSNWNQNEDIDVEDDVIAPEMSGSGRTNGGAEEFGTYKIYSVLNETFLECTTNEGKVYEYDLSVDNNGSTFLDNTKYFVLTIEGCY